jgi:hypothetical protein
MELNYTRFYGLISILFGVMLVAGCNSDMPFRAVDEATLRPIPHRSVSRYRLSADILTVL